MTICPKCNGTKRIELTEAHRPYAHILAGYDRETDTLLCDNCGGQTMSGVATGEVRERPDGTACWHEYDSEQKGNCYRVYTCKHCGYRYDIDSSD